MLIKLLVILLQASQPTDGFILRLITESLQNNVAGEPILHERTQWNFDPEAAKKARALYYEVGGSIIWCSQLSKPFPTLAEEWFPVGQVHRATGRGPGWPARGAAKGAGRAGYGSTERRAQCELSASPCLVINNNNLNLTLVSFVMPYPAGAGLWGLYPAYCHHFNLLRLIVIVRINVLHKDLHNLHNVEPWDSASIHNFLCFPLIVNDGRIWGMEEKLSSFGASAKDSPSPQQCCCGFNKRY